MAASDPKISSIEARAYLIPTDAPEADGTMQWDSTTMVVAHVRAGGIAGMGYTYTHASAASVIEGPLAEVVRGENAFDIPKLAAAMRRRVRNMGGEGIAATAISALDLALWDLKARLLDLPLARLLGLSRTSVPIYGSGGFTTYSDDRLREQLGGWVEKDGCAWVKMKIGTRPEQDPHRMEVARQATGDRPLFVDANGAFTARQAIRFAIATEGMDVQWFEEPVSSDHLDEMRFVREHMPANTAVAAGEYGYTPSYFKKMLAAGAVDVLQADVTRCLGITGFMMTAAMADAEGIDLSGHCGPAMHLAVAASVPRLRHLEWFHDHVRIEAMLLDGAPVPREGKISPDLASPGNGLTFKQSDAERYSLAGSA